jgi:hypothetical protein
MTTSNSYDYSVTAQGIIEGSLRVLGVIAAGETPTADELADALEALNLLVKSWQQAPNPLMRGVQPWHRVETTIDVSSVGAKQGYTLAASGADVTMQIPVDIVAVTRVTSDSDRVPMIRVTFDEFVEWGDRTDTGTPSRWFYERGLTSGKLWFNLLPSDTADDYVITSIRPLQDLDSLTNDVEFPQEWMRALKFNLAVEIAPEYGIQVGENIVMLAQQSLGLANYTTPESTSAYFQPGVD